LLEQLEHGTASAIDEEEYAIGYTCIAVPVRAPNVIASLAIALPPGGKPCDLDATVRRLQTSAGKLSLELGAAQFGQFTI
jgi:DNA-binding IclR family transcriptional regulator